MHVLPARDSAKTCEGLVASKERFITMRHFPCEGTEQRSVRVLINTCEVYANDGDAAKIV